MKIIAVLGDSHTWGQGVGAESLIFPPVVNADLRMTTFEYPHYVNLLRDFVNAATDSHADEYQANALADGGRIQDTVAVFDSGSAAFCADFAYARLFVRVLPGDPVRFHLTLDGQNLPDAEFSVTSDAWNDGLFPLHFLANTDGKHTLTVRVDEGALRLYRLECYSGQFAVVNCGIGSCPVARYLDRFYDRYISPMNPYGVLFEGCTINDWLTGEGPQTYAAHVREMLDRLTSDGAHVVCHTVFPVAGSQTFGGSSDLYADYVEAGRAAVLEAGIPLVDCYATLRAGLDARPEETHGRWLYNDPWHPNAIGHYLYAKEIYPTLAHIML